MDVLVYSTVSEPVSELEPVSAEVFTHPRDVAVFIEAALVDLAEAGLQITGPDVTRVHPLARHISRSQVIYRFTRDDGYTARHLVEFADWGRYCVFRVGNGPFRNLDGENLAAPGQGVKVPVHLDAYRRRQKNLRTLRQAGLELDEQIPVIPAEAEVRLRDHAEVVYRLAALSLVVDAARHVRHGSVPPADDQVAAQEWVDASMTVRERGFLADVGAARAAAFDDGRVVVPAGLRSEAELLLRAEWAVEALAWAAQLRDLPPQRLRAWDFDARVWATAEPAPGAEDSPAALLMSSARLRGVRQLLEAFDLVHILHHGRDCADRHTARIALIAEQWTKALAWILAPTSAWGEAERLL
ncbi:DUF4272 domain-containing protein [Corynebacterium sp.]|uniref:DUF4272 domain-containing protein n=1 Tax=Corynebacterium sp. TaxID=1720 RepID=UPI0026E111D0|nr:DUF4272 domain-containing protein [Corynebacterium sp.]MDO5511904.1 DUF4272 domain-containing protein [Corynebacterium sp.]